MYIEKLAVLQNSRKYLSLTMLFPSDKEISNVKIMEKYTNYKCLIGIVLTVYFAIGCLIHLIINIQNGSLIFIDRDVVVLVSYNGFALYCTEFVRNENKFLKIFKQLSDFENFGKPTNFDRVNMLFNKYSTIFFMAHSVFLVIIIIFSLLLKDDCEKLASIYDVDEICGIILSTWLPFNCDYFPLKQMIIIYQIWVTMFIYNNAAMLDYVILESVEHVVLRFVHVAETFCDIMKETDPLIRKRMFSKAVRYHIMVLEMASTLQKSLRVCLLSPVTTIAPVMGLLFARILMDKPTDSLLAGLGWTFSIFLLSTAGQRLTDVSYKMSEMIYQADWQYVDMKLQKDLTFIMMRCTKPIYLTAGDIVNINYDLFIKVIKTSYSFMTLWLGSVSDKGRR